MTVLLLLPVYVLLAVRLAAELRLVRRLTVRADR